MRPVVGQPQAIIASRIETNQVRRFPILQASGKLDKRRNSVETLKRIQGPQSVRMSPIGQGNSPNWSALSPRKVS